MRKAIAYITLAGAVGMFLGIAEIVIGRPINSPCSSSARSRASAAN